MYVYMYTIGVKWVVVFGYIQHWRGCDELTPGDEKTHPKQFDPQNCGA
jgi:hypothetical protein